MLHEALIDVAGFFNRPQNDVILLREAGVSLDRALFPLLVLIQRRGPLGVGELADWVGRDYTTVSRQVAKLEKLSLVARRTSRTDARVTEAVVTDKGQAISDMLDAARERLAQHALAGWSKQDLAEFALLLRRFADSLTPAARGTVAARRRDAEESELGRRAIIQRPRRNSREP